MSSSRAKGLIDPSSSYPVWDHKQIFTESKVPSMLFNLLDGIAGLLIRFCRSLPPFRSWDCWGSDWWFVIAWISARWKQFRLFMIAAFFSLMVLVMLVVYYCQIFCVTVSRCAALWDVNRPGSYSGYTVHLFFFFFYVLLTVQLRIILDNAKLDTDFLCFTIRLL